ncbi:uncharacterized protein LOC126973520 [Leptidea sinapis]|uniref:uncharacterized protein LOC126973520 n=1 Tax=Leptidea sinapis TaxID=189913 RepID=UPI0021429F64|nr:uncharacterized protein LOC126973520 [Leptidea sinapis]
MAKFRKDLENCTQSATTNESPDEASAKTPCERIIEASGQVTRISELALWATNQLKERKFAENKNTAKDEEEKLLMKLAWFLDQLARLTGYEPELADATTTPALDDTTETEEDKIGTLEIMDSVENGPSVTLPPKRSIQKRSLNDPTTVFVQNFIKHKVWNNDNTDNNNNHKTFDVQNELQAKRKQKRTIKFPTIMWEVFKPKNIIEKVKRLQVGLKKFQTPGIGVAVTKTIRKRAANYANEFSVPKVPENPMQDISYYVKNKVGTYISPDIVQELQVKDNMEKILDRGNINNVWFYGSNVKLGIQPISKSVNESSSDSHSTNL